MDCWDRVGWIIRRGVVEHVVQVVGRLVKIWVDHDIEILGVFKCCYGHGRGNRVTLYSRVSWKINGESFLETRTSDPTLNAQTC